MAKNQNKADYDNNYIKQKYDIIKFLIPKGNKEKLKELAQKKDTSVSKIIIDGVERYYNISITDKG